MLLFHSLFVATVFFLFSFLFSSCSTKKEYLINPKKPHHIGNKFRNYPEVEPMPSKGFMFFLRRIKNSIFLEDSPKSHSLTQKDAIAKYNKLVDKNTITWLGHSAFLIKINGKVILTDPYISTYAGPVPVFGPRRIAPLGIDIEDFPKIDIILLSHNHYDHLNGIEDIANKKDIQVITPLKNGYIFKDAGFINIKEKDWYEKFEYAGFVFSLHPAVHNSQRGAFDYNKSLWGSWVVESSSKSFFFSGDTAYSKTIFKKIGKEHGELDYAFVPIGAYAPRELMRMIHTNPEEAVKIGIDVKAKRLIGMHWGTVNLTDEPMFEPPVLFKKAGKSKNKETIVMKIGDTIVME